MAKLDDIKRFKEEHKSRDPYLNPLKSWPVDEIRLADLIHIGMTIPKLVTGKWYHTLCGIALPQSLALCIPNIESAEHCPRCEAQFDYDKENE